MRQFIFGLALFAILALIGCTMELEPPKISGGPAEQERKEKPLPEFIYRPGGGLTIRGNP